MDAMESDEELTLLGQHIAELPLEPHLGKMVLFAVVLKCLDPVLTIACALSHKNPCEWNLSVLGHNILDTFCLTQFLFSSHEGGFDQ